MKNTHGGVLILVKLQTLAFNFTKINTPPGLFFTLFKIYKWYQIAQRTTCIDDELFFEECSTDERRVHCQRFLPSQNCDTRYAGFEPMQSPSLYFIE